MTRSRHPGKLSRRTLLRGMVGGTTVGLALPMLDAMLNENGDALADGSELPRRLLTWMFGNGCRREHWIPATEGPSYKMPSELAPLVNVRDYCTVLTGFRNYVAGRRGHHDGMAGLFSCHPFIKLEAQGAPYASKFGAPTVAQIAADIMGNDTVFKSLQVGVTKRHMTTQGPTLETMSHRGPDEPLMAERDPQKLYDKLFNSFMPDDDPEQTMRSGALDAVLQDAQRLQKRVGAADRQRLDAHLESIFQLQKQIMAVPPSCNLPSKPPKLDWNEDGSEPLVEINEVMAQLVVMAFACDLTRVASFMFTGASGGQQFSMLPPSEFPNFEEPPDYSSADQHNVSHNNNTYEQEFIHKSVIVSMECCAYLLELMKDASEGRGNLLDQSCVLIGSDVSEGWAHSEVDFPLIVAGRAGGRLKYQAGHYRSATEESISNVTLACLKSVLPDPDAVKGIGGASAIYDGYSETPCSAVIA